MRHELVLPQEQAAEARVDHLRDAIHHALEGLGAGVAQGLGEDAGLERGTDPVGGGGLWWWGQGGEGREGGGDEMR